MGGSQVLHILAPLYARWTYEIKKKEEEEQITQNMREKKKHSHIENMFL